MKFLKKVGYSITKIEKYGEMATEGLGKAIAYLAILVLIMTIILCGCTFVKINEQVQKVVNYIDTEIPEFSYKDNALTMEGEQPLKIENPETGFNKIIIDTKTENEEDINKYKEEIKNSESGLLIAKDNITIMEGTQEVKYSYSDIVNVLEKKEFNKAELLGFLRGPQIIKIYLLLIQDFII